MSRIGKQPIAIPAKVKVEVKGQQVSVEGPKGKLAWALPQRTSLKVDGTNIVVSRAGEDTTLGKVRELILAAEKTKLPIMRIIDQYMGFYTPLVLVIGARDNRRLLLAAAPPNVDRQHAQRGQTGCHPGEAEQQQKRLPVRQDQDEAAHRCEEVLDHDGVAALVEGDGDRGTPPKVGP